MNKLILASLTLVLTGQVAFAAANCSHQKKNSRYENEGEKSRQATAWLNGAGKSTAGQKGVKTEK